MYFVLIELLTSFLPHLPRTPVSAIGDVSIVLDSVLYRVLLIETAL